MRLTTLSRRAAGVFGTLGLLSLLLTFPLSAAGAAQRRSNVCGAQAHDRPRARRVGRRLELERA